MDEKDYQNQINAIRYQLNDGRKRTIETLRKKDPDVIEAYSIHSQRSAQLSANYEMAKKIPRGQFTNEEFQRQQAAIDEKRDDVVNSKIRPGFLKAREEMIMKSFSGEEDILSRAREDLKKDQSLQWLRDPKEEKKEDKDKTEDYENASKEDSSEKAESEIQIETPARINEEPEKEIPEAKNSFNKASLIQEYNAGEEFPGFDDYSSVNAGTEPTQDGQEIDIGDRE